MVRSSESAAYYVATAKYINYRVLDSAHLACVTHTVYYYAVTNFLDPSKLLSVTWYVQNLDYPIYTI